MKNFIIILFVLYHCGFAFSQERLSLNNDIYMVIGNGYYIVVGNSATNAITTLGTGGNIISEGEFNRLKWNIGISSGIYIIIANILLVVDLIRNKKDINYIRRNKFV